MCRAGCIHWFASVKSSTIVSKNVCLLRFCRAIQPHTQYEFTLTQILTLSSSSPGEQMYFYCHLIQAMLGADEQVCRHLRHHHRWTSLYTLATRHIPWIADCAPHTKLNLASEQAGDGGVRQARLSPRRHIFASPDANRCTRTHSTSLKSAQAVANSPTVKWISRVVAHDTLARGCERVTCIGAGEIRAGHD
jgi:hypothetical protein